MSEYNLALDFLTKAEGGSEHKEAIQAHVKALMDESKDRFTKLKEATAKLKRLNEVAGGNEEDLEKVVADLQKQVRELTTERDSLRAKSESSTKELETLKTEKAAREKEAKLRQLSEKAGADHEAFVQLFSELSLELVGETITVKDGEKNQSLEDYLAGQPAWKKAALFSSKESLDPPTTGKLPTAPTTSGSQKDTSSAGDRFLAAKYSASRFGKK